MTTDPNLWEQILAGASSRVSSEEYRRWLSGCSYASDSGDQITIWVPSEPDRRHIMSHYLDMLEQELRGLGRPETQLRFVVAGYGEDEDPEAEGQ